MQDIAGARFSLKLKSEHPRRKGWRRQHRRRRANENITLAEKGQNEGGEAALNAGEIGLGDVGRPDAGSCGFVLRNAVAIEGGIRIRKICPDKLIFAVRLDEELLLITSKVSAPLVRFTEYTDSSS